MSVVKYDFGGYATRNDLRCTDGRTIRRNAFIGNDGKRVSLVWQHQHNSPENVLGHADLENREDGVYAYCSFNNTPQAKTAKELVAHGDVKALSIFAGQLKQKGGDVLHGDIKEVSLVISGANSGALIDEIAFAHSDTMCSDESIIWIDGDYLSHGEIEVNYDDEEEDDEMMHEDKNDKTVQDVLDEMTEEQRDIVSYLVSQALESASEGKEEMKHADEDTEDDTEDDEIEHADDDRTVDDIIKTMNKDQKAVLDYLVSQALEAGKKEDEDSEEEKEMKHNAFDTDDRETVLMHSEMLDSIVNEAKRFGSLKESYLAHASGDEEEAEAAGAYGIKDIEWLQDEAKNLNVEPGIISRPMEWVSKVLGGVHQTPFSRIKSVFADIREDEARAKGYIKGKRKKEEVFSLLKRTTIPTTIYKKQKLDRDDVADITTFNVVKFIRAEMDVMLDEEKARAILVGDGRLASDEDKIAEDKIRPIWTDDNLYSVKITVPVEKTAGDNVKADKFIEACIRSRKEYKGSGNPTLFTTEDRLTSLLLLKDANGRFIYESQETLRNVLRVKEIITVPVMENLRRNAGNGKAYSLEGIIVNLTDYNVGTDPLGKKNFFDDFDIDYNQMKYLLECRFSGALVKPMSALVIEFDDNTASIGD